jgi:tyrosinase
MADNAYTAFDPIFWSYHSNIDRIFEEWNRAHPAAQFSSKFPLRPSCSWHSSSALC